jgi:hypothetical protein
MMRTILIACLLATAPWAARESYGQSYDYAPHVTAAKASLKTLTGKTTALLAEAKALSELGVADPKALEREGDLLQALKKYMRSRKESDLKRAIQLAALTESVARLPAVKAHAAATRIALEEMAIFAVPDGMAKASAHKDAAWRQVTAASMRLITIHSKLTGEIETMRVAPLLKAPIDSAAFKAACAADCPQIKFAYFTGVKPIYRGDKTDHYFYFDGKVWTHLKDKTYADIRTAYIAAYMTAARLPTLEEILAAKVAKTGAIPKQEDALDQFSHAMMTYYLPAGRAKGEERKKLCKKAILALAAVWEYFPETKSHLILIEAHFYQGMCYKSLGQTRKAVDAFLAAHRIPVPGAALDKNQADQITYHRQARNQLMSLRKILTNQEREEIEREE